MRYLAIAVASLAAAAIPAYAQHPAPDAVRPANLPVQAFVEQAATINMYEIAAARLAEDKAIDASYKNYATMIITDHTNMSHDLKLQVAKMQGVEIPNELDAFHDQKLRKLKSEQGASFERSYRAGQIEGHEAAIKLFENFAQNGSNPDLKSLAQASVPILQKHLERAEHLPEPTGPAVGAAEPATPSASSSMAASTTTGANTAPQPSDAQDLVNRAVTVVKDMKADHRLVPLLRQAKGLYIVPDFGRGGLIIGGRGGVGLVTLNHHGKWSDPAFYDMGGISVGPQVGGSGGSIAFLLMSQGAVDAFKSGNKFSLNAGAGLSIVNYSANSQASWGNNDIILWSDTSGAYVGATISVTDVNWDDSNNRNYYGKNVDMTRIIDGSVSNAGAEKLQSQLPG